MKTSTASLPQGAHLEDFPGAQCLSIMVNEEWHHRLYAEPDLDALAPSTNTED